MQSVNKCFNNVKSLLLLRRLTEYKTLTSNIMKKFFAGLVMVVLATMLTGCATSTYLTTNVNLNQTNVVLQEKNFHIVKTVEAKASSTHFLGLGGIGRKALKRNAVAELTTKANLTGAQALINITVKEDIQTVFVWSRRTVRATGTVIEFDR